MERCCRCLRYVVRSIKQLSKPLLPQMAEKLVTIYQAHPHSCCLYLCSIMVWNSYFFFLFNKYSIYFISHLFRLMSSSKTASASRSFSQCWRQSCQSPSKCCT